MRITAWRIYKPAHAADAFTGKGSRLYGGRWNSKGVAVIYTSGTVSLAALEMLVHMDVAELLLDYHVCSVSFDDGLLERLPRKRLPRIGKPQQFSFDRRLA